MFRSIPDPHKHTRHTGGDWNFLLFQHRTLNAIQDSLETYRSAAFVKYPGWRGAARCVYRPCLMELPQHPSAGWPPPSSPALCPPTIHLSTSIIPVISLSSQSLLLTSASDQLRGAHFSNLSRIGEILSAASHSLARSWRVFAWTCDSFCFVVT